jgi:hypothetical protein
MQTQEDKNVFQEEDDKLKQAKKDARESGADFRFFRRMLLQELTERATWRDHREKMAEALDVLNAKSKAKNTLSKSEAETIRRALGQSKDIAGAFNSAGAHARVLFEIIDEAAELYKHGSRKHARMLGWTTGKRGKTEDHNSIVATYLFQIGMDISKKDAVGNIAKLFNMTSPGAVIDILKRAKKKIPILPLPNNWHKI